MPDLRSLDDPVRATQDRAWDGEAYRLVDTAYVRVARVTETPIALPPLHDLEIDPAILAHRGFVLESGRVALSGTGRELLASAQVREAYLGL